MSEIKFTDDFETDFSFIENDLKTIFSAGKIICIKIHMGKPGNNNHIKAEQVKKLVKIMNELGLKPFVLDTTVGYNSPRKTVEGYQKAAKDNGFAEEKIGCPVIISEKGTIVKTQHLEVQVCNEILQADGIIVLTHAKGHECSGMGGAIKNLGMGALTKETKHDIHNKAKAQIIHPEKCIQCKTCERYCPAKAIKVTDKPIIDHDKCYGCDICVLNCPSKVFAPKVALIDELLAEGAFAAVKDFIKNKKIFLITFLNNISLHCDCFDHPSPIIGKDVGIISGQDIVAIDNAAVDLINEKNKKDVFALAHHKNPKLQVDFAEKLGMGKKDYKILKI